MGLYIEIHNDGTRDDNLIGHYDVTARINRLILWRGRVENHVRSDGWKELLLAVALTAIRDTPPADDEEIA